MREMQKGCNYEVAAQRVVQIHGADALRNRALTKRAADMTDTFAEVAADIECRDGCRRIEVLRKARLEHPHLYATLQIV
jgi:hypothetical protein